MTHYIFRLPDIGEGIAEAEIAAWHVQLGDRLQEDQPMVDLMTDKATVEMTSPVTGRITALHGKIGERVPVGSPLVEVERDGEGLATVPAPVPPVMPPPAAPPPAMTVGQGAVLASPATRRRAHEHGIALQSVPGTGAQGRVTAQDLDDFAALRAGGLEALRGFMKRTGVTETKITGLRRRIAEKMQDSSRRIPHFSYIEEFDLTELEALRKNLNGARSPERPQLTLLPFFMRALVQIIPEFPEINARFDDAAGVLQVAEAVHIGIATQTPAGLMVPVVRHVEARDLWDCARELARVAQAARDASATRDELTGSTITLTSLGALGGIAATPIINAPEVAIIGPNKLVQRPVVINGQIAIRTMMNVSAAFDHRIIDGFVAASFIQGIKRLIEQPQLLVLEAK